MQPEDTRKTQTLALSRSGVLFVSGFATSLRVHRGHLVVRSGNGRGAQEVRLSRVSNPRLRRLVVFGRGGYATWEALEWLAGIGAAFAQLSRSGQIISSSWTAGPNQPALRRAQVMAAESEVGREIVRSLLSEKLTRQRCVLNGFRPTGRTVEVFNRASTQIDNAPSVSGILSAEARAAAVYWKAWAGLPLAFSRSNLGSVPEHWRFAGDRRSPLSASPRLAANPVGAILNYLYALAEFECRLAVLAVGLDPGLGWAHKDVPYRDSAVLDILEPIRPQVDTYVVQTLRERTFSRREFTELPTGQVRLATSLARLLTLSTLAEWESAAAPLAEAVARDVAASARVGIRVPGKRTRGSGGKGKSTLGRRVAPGNARLRRIPSACRLCGIVLDDPERQYCPGCLPEFKEQRTGNLVRAAREVLAEMRASPNDPARSPQAIAKRVATNAARREAALAWERENPGPHDPAQFTRDILPRLSGVTIPQMVRATGLSSTFCWRIRRGEQIPHAMYWEAFRILTQGAQP
jgi:CRISPR-associated endonuclease Cas1